jgi:hypothetical protein
MEVMASRRDLAVMVSVLLLAAVPGILEATRRLPFSKKDSARLHQMWSR